MTSGTYSWEVKRKMNNPRVFATPLVYGGNIFVIGGCDQTGAPLDTFEYYETAKRKWHNLPSMETKRAAPAAQVVGDKIVAIGGVGETQAPVDAVEVYDIKAKKWFKMESLTEPLQGVSSILRGMAFFFILVCRNLPRIQLIRYRLVGKKAIHAYKIQLIFNILLEKAFQIIKMLFLIKKNNFSNFFTVYFEWFTN